MRTNPRLEWRGLFLYNGIMFRIYVERQKGFENEARRILSDVKNFLGVSSVKSARYLNRYDIENVMPAVAKTAVQRIFSEPLQ